MWVIWYMYKHHSAAASLPAAACGCPKGPLGNWRAEMILQNNFSR